VVPTDFAKSPCTTITLYNRVGSSLITGTSLDSTVEIFRIS
jgi:hypothetical protein